MAVDCGLLTDLGQIEKLYARLAKIEDGFGFDIETGFDGPPRPKFSLHPETANLAGVSVSGDPSWARYTAIRYRGGRMSDRDFQEYIRLLAVLLGSCKGIPFNYKFELRHLAREFRNHLSTSELAEAGLEPDGYFPAFDDPMIGAYLLGEFRYHGLKYLTEEVFGYQQAELTDLFTSMTDEQEKCLRFTDLELTPAVISYACDDAAFALALSHKHRPRVCDKLLYRVEMEIIPILARMEDYGIQFDFAGMSRTAVEAERFAAAMRAEIMKDLSRMLDKTIDINLNSPPQVSDVLYNQLGFRTTRMTKGSAKTPPKMSTDEKALTGLAKKHSVVARILQYREVKKLVGAYLKKFVKDFSYASDGRVHPSHNQVRIVSGRFAVTDPNYQNLPKLYEYILNSGLEFILNFRDFVVAAPRHYFLGFDYSQIELRVMAGLSQEPAMTKAFQDGVDIHKATASLMFEVPLSEVTKDYRQTAKAQPVESKVLTPTGWRRFGDLQVGDAVIGSDGFPVKVTGVFPQGLREVFEVQTTDGATTECCMEHLWTVKNCNTKNAKWQTYELQHLLHKGLGRPEPSGYVTAKWQLPDRPIIQYDVGSELPIDPYVMGLLLGDGCFRHDWAAGFGSEDLALIEAVSQEAERLGCSVKFGECFDDFWNVFLVSGTKGAPNKLSAHLRKLGLWMKVDEDKFVPEIYMQASPSDRLALLQGLQDTDGSAHASASEFKVTSRQLAVDVQELTRSLGGWASFNYLGVPPKAVMKFRGKVIQGRKPVWRTRVKLPLGMVPFRLERKLANLKTVKYSTRVSITSATSLGMKETQCISIGNADGLYISDNYLVTHNTQNFAILYGQGAKGISERLGISVEESQTFMDKYFSIYASVKSWVSKQKMEGIANGFTMSRFGRKHPIWELESESAALRATGERLCVNCPTQGGAADLMKIAMVRAERKLREAGLSDQVHLIMNIHDALVWEVHSSVSPQTIIDLVQSEVCLEIPDWPVIEVDWEIGRKWGSMLKLKLDENNQIVLPTKDPEPQRELAMAG